MLRRKKLIKSNKRIFIFGNIFEARKMKLYFEAFVLNKNKHMFQRLKQNIFTSGAQIEAFHEFVNNALNK